jgi:hypothetical protein
MRPALLARNFYFPYITTYITAAQIELITHSLRGKQKTAPDGQRHY